MSLLPLDLPPNAVALLGVPSDENSSLLRGPAAAPAVIRSALFDPGVNLSTEGSVDLFRENRFVDLGDITIDPADRAGNVERIVTEVSAVIERGARVLALGGDHAVAYPLVRANAEQRGPVAIVQIDAHPDLYDDFEGNPLSHACPFARIMESKLATRLVQIGIRAATPHQREQAERFGVETVSVEGGVRRADLPAGPVYLSLDLDGLDPAFAPGVSHPEAGGLSTRQVIEIIHALPGPIVGADVVELNPRRDVAGATAIVAAKLAKEVAGRMLEA
ncbi:MAG: agmatinase [Phycisphaerales bacterium]|nr:agmatinase [Phycisphaerales bacterium]